MKFPSVRALSIVAALLCFSTQAIAAGLGRLQVQSALGEPFRAEIQVIADKNELPTLAAKMASPGAFQSAGLIFNSATASMKVALEKRANGEPVVYVTTAQPLNEPVVDLLIELSWSSGRVIREFTAFVDPPYLIAEREKQRAAAAAQAPTTQPAPPQEPPKPETLPPEPPAAAQEPIPTTPTDVAEAPQPPEAPVQAEPATPSAPPAPAPVQTIGGTAPTLFDAETQTSLPMGESYGPTQSGDTLSKIALRTKPADVTLEQMLVLLFRSNPDAFMGKNMNRLKTGKIIRLPDASDYASINATDARKAVRLQTANWRAYRERVAAAAAAAETAEQPAQQSASGQIAPKVDDRAGPASEPKDVVKLSKGESAPSAAAGGSKAEEEVVARDKAVKEANERVAKLEKSIKDLQSLVEMKNQQMAELQRQAAGGPAATTPPKSAAPPPQPGSPTAQPAQPVTPPPGLPATPAPSAQPASPQPTVPAAPPVAASPEPAPRPAQPPAQQNRPRPAPPPPPPSLVDRVLDEPLYMAAGGLLVVVLGLLAVRTTRRRRETKSLSEEVAPARLASVGAASAAQASFSSTESDTGLSSRSRDIAQEVDPLEEAEIFLAYGRDSQAEDLLKEALNTHPRHQEVQLKLLEIYAKRRDVQAFEQLAREMQQATGGRGDLWARAVQLGYEMDPSNPRYAAGRGSPHTASDTNGAPAERLDFDVGLGDDTSSTTTDIDLGSTSHYEKTQIFNPADLGIGSEPTASSVDLNIDVPAVAPQGPEPTAPSGNALEFDFDISKLPGVEPVPEPASAQSASSDGGLDFDIGNMSLTPADSPQTSSSASPIDLSGISLDLEGAATSPSAASIGKDEKWYEVQTKFDLAKAYQEMGDKDGAREILKEVIAEGDAEQKAAAEAVLTSLG